MKNGHVLYDASDFTDEEYYSGNTIAVLVIDGGLSVCKLCGAAESQLDEPCKRGEREIDG